MARLEAESKMGFYPTPEKSLRVIGSWISFPRYRDVHLLDPCCGEGDAIMGLYSPYATRWGIELDPKRAEEASKNLNHVVQCSIFDARINPLGQMGLLWLNPPYSTEEGERVEMKFLRHAIKWLSVDGVLVFIVPEGIFGKESTRRWIAEHFRDIKIFRLVREDYPQFKQAVLFGYKRLERIEDPESIPAPPYPHIEDIAVDPYKVPSTDGPKVFQGGDSITEDDILKNRENVLKKLKEIGLLQDNQILAVRPIFPLRKGHLISLVTCGVINGKVEIGGGEFLVIKGFSDRVETVRETDKEKITTNTYRVGIRVMGPDGWYDVT